MTAILIFIGLIIGLNFIPFLTSRNLPTVQIVTARILITTTILFLTFTTFRFNGYELKGIYPNLLINVAFIISTVFYFTIFKNTKRKIMTVVILAPILLIGIVSLIFGRVKNEFTIDDTYKVLVTTGGILGCGENIKITKSQFGIFGKEVFTGSNVCLIGIYNIDTTQFDDKHIEFLIYHNGQFDSENPYKYKVERKKGW